MKKNLIALIVISLFLVSCAVFPEKYGIPLEGAEREKTVAQSDQIANEMLMSINTGDYDMFSRRFNQETRVHLPRKYFLEKRDRILGKLGKYKSYKLKGVFSHGETTPAVYIAQFEKGKMTLLIILEQTGEGYVVGGVEMTSGKTTF